MIIQMSLLFYLMLTKILNDLLFNLYFLFFVQTLPAVVQRRLKALKNLQLETTKVEAEFFKEVHALECKYQAKYLPFFEKVK